MTHEGSKGAGKLKIGTHREGKEEREGIERKKREKEREKEGRERSKEREEKKGEREGKREGREKGKRDKE